MNIAPRVIATTRTVVKTEARTIFIRVARRIEAAGRRIAQPGGNQNAAYGPETELRPSAQPGPVISNQNRIAGICGIVLHTGGLASDEPLEPDLPLEAGDVLRRVIGDAGNRVAVGDEVPGSRIDERPGTRTQWFFSAFERLGRMLR